MVTAKHAIIPTARPPASTGRTTLAPLSRGQRLALQVAQTNIQLYNQLRRRGLDRDELVLVHRAYELLTTLYSGYYQGDGKPFVAHGVGVASILAELVSRAFAQAAAEADSVPPELRASDGRRHLKLVVPRSCQLRG